MDMHHLVLAILSSPLWSSSRDLVPKSLERRTEIEGLDVAWYWRTFRDFLGPAPSMEACAEDYVRNGPRLSRSPNMAFDEAFYRRQYPEVDRMVRTGKIASGWAHYLDCGANSSYDPAAWFDDRWYRTTYNEVNSAISRGSLSCAFEHFLLYGIRQDLSPSIYFNSAWYRKTYMNNEAANRQFPVAHYLSSKQHLRPSPTPIFDSNWYAEQYLSSGRTVDRAKELSPFEHYMQIGRYIGYSPSARFDERAYRDAYPELGEILKEGKYATGFEHYICEGLLNGFVASGHMQSAGSDYSGPKYFETYEQAIALHVKRIAELRELVETA